MLNFLAESPITEPVIASLRNNLRWNCGFSFTGKSSKKIGVMVGQADRSMAAYNNASETDSSLIILYRFKESASNEMAKSVILTGRDGKARDEAKSVYVLSFSEIIVDLIYKIWVHYQ